MTYKSSYFKLCLEDMRRRLVIVVITLALFFIYSVRFLFSLLTEFVYWDEMTREEIVTSIAESCAPSGFECVLGMLMGIFLAAQGFSYLHSKRKMDFYGALPISRPRRFAVLCTNQLTLFTVPLLLVKSTQILIIMLTGYGSKQTYMNIMISALCIWLGFMALWAITAFVVIATGHLALSLAGVAIISAYVPLCRFVICEGCANLLLDTYVGTEAADFWYAFSPFSVLSELLPDWNEVWTWKANGSWLLILALYAIVFAVGAYVLFLRRQNEATGRAMAFPKGNRVVQILLVIPCGILGGLITSVWVSWISVFLVVPGVILGCCFAHMLLECIFHYNIRKVFVHKWQMIITTVVAVCIILFLGLDVIGYDSYLPEKDDIRAVYVGTYTGEAMLTVDEIDTSVEMTDELKGSLLSFVAPMVEKPNALDTAESFFGTVYSTISVDVIYVTKEGELKQRCYNLPEDYDLSGIASYYDTREYRELVWGSKVQGISTIERLEWMDLVNAEELPLSAEEQAELIRIYTEEYYNASIKENALGELNISYTKEMSSWTSDWYNCYESFYVYESCVDTIAYLESKGITIMDYNECDITGITIYSYKDHWSEPQIVTITDKAVIELFRKEVNIYYNSGVGKYTPDSVYVNILVNGEAREIAVGVSDKVIDKLMETQK